MSSERRVAPRFSKFLVLYVNGLELFTTNVSVTGMQFGCPTLRLGAIKADMEANRIAATIVLPDDQHLVALTSMAYDHDYDDEHLIGVHFESFEGDGQEIWESFVAQAA